jgi:hypothetical protein
MIVRHIFKHISPKQTIFSLDVNYIHSLNIIKKYTLCFCLNLELFPIRIRFEIIMNNSKGVPIGDILHVCRVNSNCIKYVHIHLQKKKKQKRRKIVRMRHVPRGKKKYVNMN